MCTTLYTCYNLTAKEFGISVILHCINKDITLRECDKHDKYGDIWIIKQLNLDLNSQLIWKIKGRI
jgi:hypothetical protein